MWQEDSAEQETLIPEHRALQLLDPIDQYYSPNVNLQGIRAVYVFIVQASHSFSKKLRTHFATKTEIIEHLEKTAEKYGDLDAIIDYLAHGSDASQAFIKKHYGVVIEEKKPVLRPFYIGGIENIHKVTLFSDKLSANNIHEMAISSHPWRDKESYVEYLAEQIKTNHIEKTYVSHLFDLTPVNDSQKFAEEEQTGAAQVYKNSILPHLHQHEDFLYIEIPHIFEADQAPMEPVLLIRDSEDLLTRYDYFSKLLIQIAQKAYQTNQPKEEKRVLVENLHKAIEETRAESNPATLKKLAEAVLNIYSRPDRYRQIAIEVFLLKDMILSIQEWKEEAQEAQRKKYLDLLLKRIRSRQWLLFFPASFYPLTTFNEALSQTGVLGIRKSGADLGIATNEDYYCIIETSALNYVLERANVFELAIIEEILEQRGLNSKDVYNKKIYQRKKNLVFLIINPILYFLRSLFGFKKRFIENHFTLERNKRGSLYNSSMRDSFAASGIRATPAGREESEADPGEDPEKTKLKKIVLDYIFPDPAPSAKNINENDYKARIRKAARTLKESPEFDHYYQKNEDSIIADIEAFIKPELIEDVYNGTLPSGRDSKGNPFTRKTYAPKDIKDQPIIYNMIREELEHESAYGTKDVVEYLKAKSRIYSEESMSKVREEEKLRKEAERKERTTRTKKKERTKSAAGATGKPAAPEPEKTSSKGLFGFGKKEPPSEEKKVDDKAKKEARQQLSKVAEAVSKNMTNIYTGPKNFSRSTAFPLTSGELEKKMKLKEGTFSIYASKNSQLLSENFVSVKAAGVSYFFPRKFFLSNKDQIASFYDAFVKHEEKLPIPNGDNLARAHDLAVAIKHKKI